jgi:hypothetical protein
MIPTNQRRTSFHEQLRTSNNKDSHEQGISISNIVEGENTWEGFRKSYRGINMNLTPYEDILHEIPTIDVPQNRPSNIKST